MTSFVVLSTGGGWTVFQDGEPLLQRGDKAAAVDAALELAARARGFGAHLSFQVQDGAGELRPLDIDSGARMLARLFGDRSASTAQA